MGGLLYGIDIGIIDNAVPYIEKAIGPTESQTSFIVSAVLFGSAVASFLAGGAADLAGRKKMLIAAGVFFILSVGMIYQSSDFGSLVTGRVVQGISGGMIAVVVPLYLAECVTASRRGRATALFQLFLTVGIVVASFIGKYFADGAEQAIAAAGDDREAIVAASNHAWRAMFLTVIVPGVIFTAGALVVSESPRWLFRKGRKEEASRSLLRSRSAEEATVEMAEMAGHQPSTRDAATGVRDSLLKKKYVVPFVIACIILGCNQGTGINSVLQYLTVILMKAGLDASQAASWGIGVKTMNVVATVVGVVLVDRMGRKFLLKMGTGGIILALAAAAAIFSSFESERVDFTSRLSAEVRGNELLFPATPASLGIAGDTGPRELSVLYQQGDREQVATVFTASANPVLSIPLARNEDGSEKPLVIKRARLGAIPTPATGYAVAGAMILFIISFAMGPGVCVWLALSELMPTRIRSLGMGIALLINSGVGTGIAAVFLPVVGNYGYTTMFLFWIGSTVIYFITAAFFLPETKGKTLEEIEAHFEGKKA